MHERNGASRRRPPRSSVIAWMLYDLANTTFALGVGSRYFGLWVLEVRGGSDWHIGVATIAAMAAVILLAPVLGASSDARGRRRPYLVGTTLLCVVATALLGTGELGPALVLYAVATVAFHLGTVVYDAMLSDVSTPENRGRVSGLGVAVGYAGSLVAIGLGMLLLEQHGYAWVFRALAASFLLFALPAFFFIRERPRAGVSRPLPRPWLAPLLLRDAWTRAGRTPGVVRFLVGRFLYTDAINTVFLFNAIFVRLELGFTDRETDILAVAGILAAALGAAVAGRVVDAAGPRRVLHAAIWALLAGVAMAVTASLADAPSLAWGVALLGGGALGATWASDRVYMTRLVEPERLGEAFGLYATVGRFATITGPLTWALIAEGFGWGRTAAYASLAINLLVARLVLQRVSDRPRETAVT